METFRYLTEVHTGLMRCFVRSLRFDKKDFVLAEDRNLEHPKIFTRRQLALDRERFLANATDHVVWFLAKPYVAGQGLDALYDKMERVYGERRLLSTGDLLGEELIWKPNRGVFHDDRYLALAANADRNKEVFMRMVDGIVARAKSGMIPEDPGKKPSISIKPSSLCVLKDGDPRWMAENCFVESYTRMRDILRYANDPSRAVNVTIDMEDSRWTQFTVDAYLSLVKSGCANAGIVLQSKLGRTAHDLERIIMEVGDKARVRLCIGIYEERGNPDALPLTRKGEMKERMLPLARMLVDAGGYAEFATHDMRYVQRFFTDVVIPRACSPRRFELQMLLGVPRSREHELLTRGGYFTVQRFMDEVRAAQSNPDSRRVLDELSSGVKVRLYVPTADDGPAGLKSGINYCKRRLARNEDMWKNALHYGPQLYLESLLSTLKE